MKKNTKRVLLLTIFFIFYYLFVTKGCKFLYGSVLDWNCQHYLIPDYFRKLFYETGKLLPNFALNLGGGQNIYNLSYYGFLSPVILISYLLPFVSMKNYIIISSILLIYFSVILFYKWISTKFDDKMSFISTVIFLLSTPLLFHTHRHIMFINYMPFLILGLIGVDKYFEQNKKSLLTLSVFLIIMSSYFFSVGALVGIVIYGIYIYIKRNDNITFKSFLIDGFKFLIPIFIGVLSSMVILLPTFMALLSGRGESSVVIDYARLFIPNINIKYILYNTYSPGLTSVIFFSIIYLIINMKRENKFLAILFLLITIFPIFMFVLNGGMYINSKVLIPLLPLYVLIIAISLKEVTTLKKVDYKSLIIFLVICLLITLKNKEVYFILDYIVTFIALLSYNFMKRDNILLSVLIVIFLVSFLASSRSDKLVRSGTDYNPSSVKVLTEYVEKIDDEFYRISNRNGGLGSANYVVNASNYKTGIYSSLSNQNYQDFYYDLIGNNIQNRSRGQLSEPRNLLFNIYMGNKYMMGSYASELGYTKIKEVDGNYLYVNHDVFPLGYSKTKLMSTKDFNKLTYPYNAEALLNYIIVDNVKSSPYQTNIKPTTLNYTNTYSENIKITKSDNYTVIESLENGILRLKLDSPIKNKLLFIKFDLLEANSCFVGDNAITINGILNKLTCKSWKYQNKNSTFEYTISEKNLDMLEVKFDKGTYKISNIELYEAVYDDFVSSYNELSKMKVNSSLTKGDKIVGDIVTNDKGYVNLTIPYDKGFSIYVNGVKTDYIKTNMSFIGFKVGSGSNHIEITYTAPYSNISKIMSLVGILLFSVELYYEKKCKTILK